METMVSSRPLDDLTPPTINNCMVCSAEIKQAMFCQLSDSQMRFYCSFGCLDIDKNGTKEVDDARLAERAVRQKIARDREIRCTFRRTPCPNLVLINCAVFSTLHNPLYVLTRETSENLENKWGAEEMPNIVRFLGVESELVAAEKRFLLCNELAHFADYHEHNSVNESIVFRPSFVDFLPPRVCRLFYCSSNPKLGMVLIEWGDIKMDTTNLIPDSFVNMSSRFVHRRRKRLRNKIPPPMSDIEQSATALAARQIQISLEIQSLTTNMRVANHDFATSSARIDRSFQMQEIHTRGPHNRANIQTGALSISYNLQNDLAAFALKCQCLTQIQTRINLLIYEYDSAERTIEACRFALQARDEL
jgi:hypothetical protein